MYFAPTEFCVSFLPQDHPEFRHYSLFIQRRSPTSWAVVWPGTGVLSSSGEWHHESVPSERTEEWLSKHRFPLTEAIGLAEKVAPDLYVNGRTATDIIADERHIG